MATNPLDHFAVLTISYNYFGVHFPITITTDHPCHLWLRWSITLPQKHINPVIVRGAPIGTYIDQCFVAFYDLEQSQMSDTFVHTFYSTLWTACTRRWFYFHGTVGGIVSPSASPIFSKHRPYTEKLYSDPDTGATTCDSTVARVPVWDSFFELITGDGLQAYPTAETLYTMMRTHTTPDKWRSNYRSIMTFDLSIIPGSSAILAATFRLYGEVKQDSHGDKPALAVFNAYPGAMNNIMPADYQAVGSTRLTNEIGIDAFNAAGPNEFNFTPAGLAYLRPGRTNAIALRESRYDAMLNSPPWVSGKALAMSGYSTDSHISTWRPYLMVAHSPLGV